MSREVVRRPTSDRTHLADVEKTTLDEMFGKPYRTPFPGVRALCGVMLFTGSVIMREGTKVRCPACRYLGSTTEFERLP